jgi:hypothetical protein
MSLLRSAVNGLWRLCSCPQGNTEKTHTQRRHVRGVGCVAVISLSHIELAALRDRSRPEPGWTQRQRTRAPVMGCGRCPGLLVRLPEDAAKEAEHVGVACACERSAFQ